METELFEPLKHDRVRVDRGNGQVFDAVTIHALYMPEIVNRQVVGRSSTLLGICVRDDRGFQLYAQPSHLELVSA